MTISTNASAYASTAPVSSSFIRYVDQNNLIKTNQLRSYLYSLGYDFKSLCVKGVTLNDLENLYFYDDVRAKYKVTKRKRDWMIMQLDRLADFLDIKAG